VTPTDAPNSIGWVKARVKSCTSALEEAGTTPEC